VLKSGKFEIGNDFIIFMPQPTNYSRNVIDVDLGLVAKLALPGKVTRHAYKVYTE
jgi:hypothetical protein